MTKAVVKKGELRLFFAKKLDKSKIKHFALPNPHRDIYDFKDMKIAHERVPLGLGNNVRIAQNSANTVRVVIESQSAFNPTAYQPIFGEDAYHISLPKGNAYIQKEFTPAKQAYSKPQVQKKERSKPHTEVIVIDAGHGGHDSGAIAGGKTEKELVLQISKKVITQLKKRGYPVYLTRGSDRFLKLNERTRIADKKDAKVFISIHANSVVKSKRDKMQGIETFFLQNTRDERSQRIAAIENKAVLKGTDSVSKNVIIDSVLSGPKIVESNKLAIDIHRRMMSNARVLYKDVKDGGVRHAPFYVLVGASRPSVLIEVGYISHAKERKRLFSSNYQKLLAKGIVEGIENYLKNRRREIDF
ncbi:N-acetylmuramoyl-L-alanine amidase [Sulfurovum sp. zt1-1]|uniref:N-acetylmuramoyl-L-alanine amidase n=1 Tax=Sulfurovum zhangzhouensis TaxID=3019067 RepID=A0ABT7QW97_9BACT|nr:N-acetylmuramoyl-L-alanine amidase [Sulfurovum zhangzhouensis]MDM5271063.1 N-acetylmuramoyl-L-alanine amidase [Sulfurovum zhangzhouensis]